MCLERDNIGKDLIALKYLERTQEVCIGLISVWQCQNPLLIVQQEALSHDTARSVGFSTTFGGYGRVSACQGRYGTRRRSHRVCIAIRLQRHWSRGSESGDVTREGQHVDCCTKPLETGNVDKCRWDVLLHPTPTAVRSYPSRSSHYIACQICARYVRSRKEEISHHIACTLASSLPPTSPNGNSRGVQDFKRPPHLIANSYRPNCRSNSWIPLLLKDQVRDVSTEQLQKHLFRGFQHFQPSVCQRNSMAHHKLGVDRVCAGTMLRSLTCIKTSRAVPPWSQVLPVL